MADATTTVASPPRARRARPRVTALQLAVGALAVLALVFIFAPLFAPYDPNGVDPANAFAGISSAHPFGTDDLGRDLLSRTLYGGRLTLLISGGAVLVALALGTLWGFFAATRGGWSDEILMRTADVLMAIPQLLFALVFVAAFGPSVLTLIVVIGVLLAPSTARMARSVALAEMGRDYYTAAIAYGARPGRLLFRELLPNTRTPIAIQAAINAASAIILEATLSFVGLGIQPPDASLGTLLQQGYGFIYQCWEYIVFPGLAILLMIWLLNVVADGLGEGPGGGGGDERAGPRGAGPLGLDRRDRDRPRRLLRRRQGRADGIGRRVGQRQDAHRARRDGPVAARRCGSAAARLCSAGSTC